MSTEQGIGALFKNATECTTPVEAKVTGKIPEWLEGSMIRTGPGKFDLGDDFVVNHWFDGYAILYNFTIRQGKVTFLSRYLQSEAYEKATMAKKTILTEFGTRAYPDPCKNIFSRFMSYLKMENTLTDNDCVNVFPIEDGLYVFSEVNAFHRIDPESLNVEEKLHWNKIVSVEYAIAHQCKDPESGDTYIMGSSFGPTAKYNIIKIPSVPSKKFQDAMSNCSLNGTITSTLSSGYGYFHSFGLSKRYIVFVEQPLLVKTSSLLKLKFFSPAAFTDCIEWQPHIQNRIHVLDKASGRLLNIHFETDTFFVFHHINTYEENNQLIVDLLAYDSSEIIDKLYLKTLKKSEFDLKHECGARRFVIPLPNDSETAWFDKLPENENLISGPYTATAQRQNNKIVLKSQLITQEIGYELPIINPSYYTKKNKYFYVVGLFGGTFHNTIAKIESDTGDIKTWRENEFTYPSECQFVARPGATKEDDGILLCAVTDIRTNEPDFLLILDATNLKEIARAQVDAQIPFLLHASFLNKQQK